MSAVRKASKSKHSECCDVMDLVLDRPPEGRSRIGMMRELVFNFRTGAERYPTVIRFRRGKKGDRYPEFRDSTYSIVKFCQFCGKKQSSGPGGP